MRLVLNAVSKRYPGGVTALHDVTLDIGPGMFGLLGPNGAGKSTLMRVVATLLRPDSGSVHFGETDVLAAPGQLRQILGYLPQEFGFYPAVPVHETLAHFAALKGVAAAGRHDVVESLLARTNLLGVRSRPVGTLSGGMRQRLGVAIALSGNPQLLILDEPTAGLDPTERRRLYDVLLTMAAECVVLLSTHLVEDVYEYCPAMAILDQGQLAISGSPLAMVQALQGQVWQGPAGPAPAGTRALSVSYEAGVRMSRVLADHAPGAGWVPAAPTLDDVYFLHVGDRALT